MYIHVYTCKSVDECWPWCIACGHHSSTLLIKVTAVYNLFDFYKEGWNSSDNNLLDLSNWRITVPKAISFLSRISRWTNVCRHNNTVKNINRENLPDKSKSCESSQYTAATLCSYDGCLQWTTAYSCLSGVFSWYNSSNKSPTKHIARP